MQETQEIAESAWPELGECLFCIWGNKKVVVAMTAAAGGREDEGGQEIISH